MRKLVLGSGLTIAAVGGAIALHAEPTTSDGKVTVTEKSVANCDQKKIKMEMTHKHKHQDEAVASRTSGEHIKKAVLTAKTNCAQKSDYLK